MGFFKTGWATFATGKMQREDPNKDGQGKGTTQRFMESSYKELDDYSIDKLDNLVSNVLDPTTCEDKYIKHFESWFGVTVFPASLVLSIRRKVIKSAMFFFKKKATKLCIEALFNLIQCTVILTETNNDFSFDSPVTFDDPTRVFDMGRCFGCSSYSLAITQNASVTTNNDFLLGCYSIIKFNHPIGAKLDSATVGGVEIVALMVTQFVLQGGYPNDIIAVGGYYKFILSGNIIKSTKLEGNLQVVLGVLKLNI